MNEKPINPQVIFWPIADALVEAKARNPNLRKRQYVKKRLSSLASIGSQAINPEREKVLETYVSKIVSLAFPVNEAAAAALQQARSHGQNVNQCLRIARGNLLPPQPSKQIGTDGVLPPGAGLPGPTFAGKLRKLISNSQAQGLTAQQAVRILSRHAHRLSNPQTGQR